jgi:hypothetical protein
MPTKKKTKKRPNKQHDVRGASLRRIVRQLRDRANLYHGDLVQIALREVANVMEAEARKVSSLR